MQESPNHAEQIAELRGQLLALECVVNALVLRLPNQAGLVVQALHATEIAAYAAALAAAAAPAATVGAFERQNERTKQLLDCKDLPIAPTTAPTD
jgi:hypothetical protein